MALDDLMCVLVGRRPTAARRACAPPHAWRKRAMQHTGRSAPQLARPVDACLSDDSALRENAATTVSTPGQVMSGRAVHATALVRRRQARTCAHDNTSRKPSTSHRNVPALGGDDGNDEGIAVGHGSLGAERGALVGPGNIRGRATKDQTDAICAPYIRRSRRPAREQHTAASASCRVRNAARVSYPLHAWRAHT